MITETTKDKIIEALLDLRQYTVHNGNATEEVSTLKEKCNELKLVNKALKEANDKFREDITQLEQCALEAKKNADNTPTGAGEFALQVQELKAELAKANRQHGITKTTLNMYKEFIELHGLTLPTSATWAKIKEGLKEAQTLEDIEEQTKQDTADEGKPIAFQENKTVCPYGCKVKSTDKPIKVGDIMCRGCEHFKGWNEYDKFVMCTNELKV